MFELENYFHSLESSFGFNVCGEGGEYETVVFDSILFKEKRIYEKSYEIVKHVDNEISPVSYIKYG